MILFLGLILSWDTVSSQMFSIDSCPYNSTDGSIKTSESCRFSKSSWSCPKGFYCQEENKPIKCKSGFFCPENSFQPVYCPGGYSCEADSSSMKICPKNFYCPLGTIKPYQCNYLAICPEGTEEAPKVIVFVVMMVLLLIPVGFFKWKDASDRVRRLKHKYEIDSINRKDSKYSLVETPALSKLSKTFDIQFENLSLTLANGVTIMGSVTGALRSGRTTAIMGPSGAGKTTFITLLTGKTKRTTGSVLINGQPDELSKYQKLIGYVPQEDIMLRELTVRDILMHSARMRLPADLKYKDIKAKVLEIISFLGMSHVLESIVGNEEERGISGGQRKRVNIGMELVAEPSVLFLDEPTSGLDSSTSYEVCAKLREIARQQGLTIAAVIHSPSPATFREFDDFMLLGKGGRVVYIGPRELAAQYFAGIGFECPPGESESDFFMDVVSGKKKSSIDPNFKLTDLFHYWELTMAGKPLDIVAVNHLNDNSEHDTPPAKKLSWFQSFAISFKAGLMGFFDFWSDIFMEYLNFMMQIFRSLVCIRDPVRESTPLYLQLWLLMKRSSKQVFRNARVLIFDVLLHFGCGVFISIATQNFTYLGSFDPEVCRLQTLSLQWQCYNATDNIRMTGMFVCLGVFFAGISAGTNTFGREKVVFWRDTASGMSAIPYYLGKFIVDIPRVIVAGAAYSAAIVLFYPLKGIFVNLLLLVELLYFSAFAMGYFLSIVFPPAKTPLIGTGFALFWSLVLSGVLPDLSDVSKAPLNSMSFLWSLSPPRWGIEYFWILELKGTAFAGEVEKRWLELEAANQTEDFSNRYIWTNQSTDLTNIVRLALMWNVISFCTLKLVNREKQK